VGQHRGMLTVTVGRKAGQAGREKKGGGTEGEFKSREGEKNPGKLT